MIVSLLQHTKNQNLSKSRNNYLLTIYHFLWTYYNELSCPPEDIILIKRIIKNAYFYTYFGSL